MTMQKRLRGMILAVAMSFAAYAAYAENITVSTYYPSPFGSYTTLTATTMTAGVLDSTGQTHLATGGGGVRIGSAADAAAGNELDVTGDARISGNLNLTAGGQSGNLQVSCSAGNCYAVYA